MPHYRIQIKLEKEPVREYLIQDDRKFLDLVYQDYKRRVYEKNGAGRVIYFDLVMITEESVQHIDDRKEVFNESNNYGVKWDRKPKDRVKVPEKTIGERIKKPG